MKTKLRKARTGDADAFVAIKEQLPLTLSNGDTTTGGFLLGTTADTYREYISNSYCLVAEENEKVIGFGIIFPDEVLRASDVWVRRHTANWQIDLEQYETQSLCYFEQFAFLQGHKRAAVALAYHLTDLAFSMGHTAMFTTTVNRPVLNLAAIPFINAANGCKAGNIDETYPIIGHINSDIYVLDAAMFYQQAAAHPLLPFVKMHTVQLT
jgi:hypothetical protein